jgi:hypothetical protein
MQMSRIIASTLCGAFLTAVAVGSAAGAECVVYRYPIGFNADSEARMIVESGKDCRVSFPLAEKMRVDSNEITAKPRYGGVRVHGTSGAYYRSNPGYRGPDQFAFSVCRADAGKTTCADVVVKVEVR